VPEIVEDAGTDVQVRSSSVFDVLGVGEPPTAISRRLQVDPDTEVSLDETLLTSTGNGGLFSTGYLHQRSLQTYLLNGEGVIFLLASKRQTPEYTGPAAAGTKRVSGYYGNYPHAGALRRRE